MQKGERPRPTVFVSYRRNDASGHAGRLYDGLIDTFGDLAVFIDVAGILPGRQFDEELIVTIRNCAAVVVVIGPGWLFASDPGGGRRLADPEDWVRIEVREALASRALVVPVLVNGAAMPNQGDLPHDIAALARCQAVELTDTRWRFDSGRLISELRKVVPAVPPGYVPPASHQEFVQRLGAGERYFAGTCFAAFRSSFWGELYEPDLSGLDLGGAILDDCDFGDADLARVDLRGALVRRSNLEQANIEDLKIDATTVVDEDSRLFPAISRFREWAVFETRLESVVSGADSLRTRFVLLTSDAPEIRRAQAELSDIQRAARRLFAAELPHDDEGIIKLAAVCANAAFAKLAAAEQRLDELKTMPGYPD